MFSWFLLFLVLSLSLSPAVGQRRFATVDPSSLAENLTFDTNDLPLVEAPLGTSPSDLNFSPNVVPLCSVDAGTGLCAPGSAKAFVSYPGSNKVLVFDPKTGQILKLVEVGENPALITPTPDGRKVAVVSLFIKDNLPQPSGDFQGKLIGSISIIDVGTLEVQRLELQNVFFSFANNIVFSADGKTGFVASAGTDEILRFDVEGASEITPRLKVAAGTRPTTITMAPDFSFFAVVLVGSTSLPRTENPDSIQIIDTNSFTARSIVPKAEEGQVSHDFEAANTLAISEDGRFGLIGDRENSRVSSLPAFAPDHAILLDLQSGETVKVFTVGGLTGASYVIPGKNQVVTISELSLAIADIGSQESTRIIPSRSEFKPTTRALFSKDGAFMFIAAPLDDLLVVVDLEKAITLRTFEIGPEVEREADGQTFTVPAAPLDVALTPDGTVLTVLKFNANVVDLLQKDTQRLMLPRILSNGEWFTGVTVTNNSSAEAEVIAKGIDRVGVAFQDLRDTEDIVEFVNPRTLRIKRGHQASTLDGQDFTCFPCTVNQLMSAHPGSEITGWLDMDSDQLGMASFFLIGDRALRRLDGGLPVSETSQEIILPEVRVTDGMRTEISLLNPSLSQVSVTITLVNDRGETVDEATQTLAPLVMFISPVRDLNLFAEDKFQDFTHGYLVLKSTEGVIAFEKYFDGERLASLNGIPVFTPASSGRTRLYFPQVVAFGGTETFVNLVHRGSEKAVVSLTLKDSEGQDLASRTLEMEAGQAVRQALTALFPELPAPEGVLSGWLLVDSGNISGLIGDVEIQVFGGRAMTAVPAQGLEMQNFVFSHVAESQGVSTGIALLNPGEMTASVVLELFTPQGILLESLSVSLAPSQRQIGLLTDFFPAASDLAAGYLKVSSDQKIVGLELFFADSLEYVATVPPQGVP